MFAGDRGHACRRAPYRRRPRRGTTRHSLPPRRLDCPQVVHHYADDHMNSYIRFKLALTEESPTIKPYSEPLWGELPDARRGPIEPSLTLLTALHQRWIAEWRALAPADWSRTFINPRNGSEVSLD